MLHDSRWLRLVLANALRNTSNTALWVAHATGFETRALAAAGKRASLAMVGLSAPVHEYTGAQRQGNEVYEKKVRECPFEETEAAYGNSSSMILYIAAHYSDADRGEVGR